MGVCLNDFPDKIRKSFVNQELNLYIIEKTVTENFQKGLVSVDEFCGCLDTIEKAFGFGKKRAMVGERRVHRVGDEMVEVEKTEYGWRPVKKEKEAPPKKYKEPERPKRTSEKTEMNFGSMLEDLMELKGIEDVFRMMYKQLKSGKKLTERQQQMINEAYKKHIKNKKDKKK